MGRCAVNSPSRLRCTNPDLALIQRATNREDYLSRLPSKISFVATNAAGCVSSNAPTEERTHVAITALRPPCRVAKDGEAGWSRSWMPKCIKMTRCHLERPESRWLLPRCGIEPHKQNATHREGDLKLVLEESIKLENIQLLCGKIKDAASMWI